MAVPGIVARIAKKHAVRLSPRWYTAEVAGFVVKAPLFSGSRIMGRVDPKPVVAAAKPGCDGTMLVGMEGWERYGWQIGVNSG